MTYVCSCLGTCVGLLAVGVCIDLAMHNHTFLS